MQTSHFVADVLFVAFNGRIAAVHRDTGELLWSWKAPHGSGFVAVLVDGDQLFASVQGYTWCLDPLTGDVVWENLLSGFGFGIPCLATANLNTGRDSGAAFASEEANRQASGTD